jgi:hypothetical protein
VANAPTVATYTNDPGSRPLDRVRLETGDTECATAYLSDEEINLYLGEETNVLRAAARAAGAIAAKCARRIDFGHGSVRKSLSQLREHYVELGAELDRRASLAGVAPEALGTKLAEKAAADQDTTAVQPEFKVGMHDNPRAGPASQSDPNASAV